MTQQTISAENVARAIAYMKDMNAKHLQFAAQASAAARAGNDQAGIGHSRTASAFAQYQIGALTVLNILGLMEPDELTLNSAVAADHAEQALAAKTCTVVVFDDNTEQDAGSYTVEHTYETHNDAIQSIFEYVRSWLLTPAGRKLVRKKAETHGETCFNWFDMVEHLAEIPPIPGIRSIEQGTSEIHYISDIDSASPWTERMFKRNDEWQSIWRINKDMAAAPEREPRQAREKCRQNGYPLPTQ